MQLLGVSSSVASYLVFTHQMPLERLPGSACPPAINNAHSNGPWSGQSAAAARARWPARGCAGLTCPFVPLGRSAKHVAVASATAYNMMECIIELDSIINTFTWACLLPRRYGRGGRLARARRSPGHLPGALAALRGPHGHQHHHCLSWTT